mgnify:CR=1 FL=1
MLSYVDSFMMLAILFACLIPFVFILKKVGKGEKPGSGGDIVTAESYGDFELALDWKLTPEGNSGLKYLIVEPSDRKGRAGVGYEMQILGDERHPHAKAGRHGGRRDHLAGGGHPRNRARAGPASCDHEDLGDVPDRPGEHRAGAGRRRRDPGALW